MSSFVRRIDLGEKFPREGWQVLHWVSALEAGAEHFEITIAQQANRHYSAGVGHVE